MLPLIEIRKFFHSAKKKNHYCVLSVSDTVSGAAVERAESKQVEQTRQVSSRNEWSSVLSECRGATSELE